MFGCSCITFAMFYHLSTSEVMRKSWVPSFDLLALNIVQFPFNVYALRRIGPRLSLAYSVAALSVVAVSLAVVDVYRGPYALDAGATVSWLLVFEFTVVSVYAFSAELFPTVVRGAGAGLCYVNVQRLHRCFRDLSKKSRTTTTLMLAEVETQRRSGSVTECLEFLMPVYLLPFVFGGKRQQEGDLASRSVSSPPPALQDGICIYCTVLTLSALMWRLLPPPIAAVLPLVILPLGEVYGADQLAAQYCGPSVLTASLLFAVAIVGDETTVFLRLCLHALRRHSLRMQPLFLKLQLLVLVLSLLLPSTLLVVFSTVLVERFVATVHNELLGSNDHQRSRARRGSSVSITYSEEAARRRRMSRKASVAELMRRARSVSVVSDATLPSEASAGSSIVKHYKLHPDWQEVNARDWQPQANRIARATQKRHPRKTSFGLFEITTAEGQAWPRHLPVRRIRAFCTDNKPPSSILKRQAQLSSPPATSLEESPSRSQGSSKAKDSRTDTCPVEYPSTVAQRDSPAIDDWQEAVETTPCRTPPSPSSAPVHRSSVTNAEASRRQSPRLSEMYVEWAQQMASRAGAPVPDTASASFDIIPSAGKQPSKAKGASSKRAGRPQAGCSPEQDSEDGLKAIKSLNRTHTLMLKDVKSLPVRPSSTKTKATTKGGSRRNFKPRPNADEKPDTTTDSNRTVEPQKSAPPPATQAESPKKVADLPVPKPEGQPEVRGILKEWNSSLQPSDGNRKDNKRASQASTQHGDGGGPESSAPPEQGRPGSDNNAAGRRIVLAPSPSPVVTADRKPAVEVASSFGFTGEEQQSSCMRLRALTMAARPAFIAGAAYTAIFGSIISFSIVPTRKTVLLALECHNDDCPVTWWSWLAVALPVALICCLICWLGIYCTTIGTSEDDINEQTQMDLSKCAFSLQRDMRRQTLQETLLFYVLVGIPLVSSAYSVHQPERHLEGPLLGVSVVVMSMLPATTMRHCWYRRLLSWRTMAARLPWNVILMLGSVRALTAIVEEYRLVEKLLAKMDDHFWTNRSSKSSQFILLSLAAVLSEVVVSDSVAQLMEPTVIRVAVATETPKSFFVVPVCLVASVNVVLPVSLPLLVMREYLDIRCAQSVAYGVFLKCATVIIVFISMNTIGLVVFQDVPLPNSAALHALCNVTPNGTIS
ncbi:uncharacterized protein LOC144146242 [Haemaphysalis longicornis]